MTDAFERGDDLHRLTASKMMKKSFAEIMKEERSAAKAVNFGAIYGMGADGLVASAWANFELVLTLDEARQHLRAFEDTFPGFIRSRDEHYKRVLRERLIFIGRDAARGIGRTFQLAWLPAGKSAYTRAANYPVQGACADAAMLALALVEDRLREEGIDGGLVAWLHDEIVLEVAEDRAEEAKRILCDAMTEAFAVTFPSAPLNGLVKAHAARDWAAAKPE